MTEVASETLTPPVEETGLWRGLLRDFAALGLGEGAARVFGLATVLLLARRLGPSDFGIVNFGLSLVGWFSLVVDSGTEMLAVRDIARHPSRFRAIADRVLGLRLAVAMVAVPVYVVVVEIFARSSYVRDTVVLFAVAIPAAALNLRWMVLGVGGARTIASGNVAARAALAGGVLLLVTDSRDLHRVPLLQGGAEAVYALVIAFIVARRFGMPRPRIDLTAWIATLRQSLPLLANAVARALFFTFDIVAIELIRGPRDVGLYSAATKPVYFVTGVLGLFSVTFLSSYSASGSAHGLALLRRASKWALAVCLPLAALLCGGAVVLVPIVFGSAYRSAAVVLAVLAWRLPLTALASPFGSALVAAGKQALLMRANIAGTLVLVPLDAVAISEFGIVGAAVGSVIANGVVLAVFYRYLVAAGLLDRRPRSRRVTRVEEAS